MPMGTNKQKIASNSKTARRIPNAVRLSTAEKWLEEPEFKPWLKIEASADGTMLARMWCSVCKNHEDRINACRNFSRAFVDGVTEQSALKRDAAVKHRKADQHSRAMNMHANPFTHAELYTSTAIGRSMASGESEDRERVRKLMDIAYMMAKEEIAFTKFEAIAKLEIRHKVQLGHTYINELKCSEFTGIIGQVMETDFLAELKKSKYISVLSDGSTDVSNVEKELVYVTYVVDAKVKTRFMALRNVSHAHAVGLTELLLGVLEDVGITASKQLVGFCADGASVNMGRIGGVAALLTNNIPAPWLVVIHCVSHRFELAVKDAFKDTGCDAVVDMLLAMYVLYEKSNKRLRELKALGEIMHEHVLKPHKANGTRWVQHKSRACSAIIQDYAVIIAHLEAQTADDSNTPAADKARLKGYLRTLRSLKFVLYLLYMKVILEPLGEICQHLQKASIDLLYAASCLEALYSSLNKIIDGAATPTAEVLGDLANVLAQAEVDPTKVKFSGIQLDRGAIPGIVTNFKAQMTAVAEKVKESMINRFTDFEHDEKIKCLQLLDTRLWPRDNENLATFGVETLDTFIENFEGILTANEVDLAKLRQEWAKFKRFWLRNLTQKVREDLWETVLLYYSDVFPNFSHVVNILMVFPGRNDNTELLFL